MEHIFFEVQLCSEIAVFKEKHVFPILIILCLGTSLIIGGIHPSAEEVLEEERVPEAAWQLLQVCIVRCLRVPLVSVAKSSNS